MLKDTWIGSSDGLYYVQGTELDTLRETRKGKKNYTCSEYKKTVRGGSVGQCNAMQAYQMTMKGVVSLLVTVSQSHLGFGPPGAPFGPGNLPCSHAA